jgi:hypothetical protein
MNLGKCCKADFAKSLEIVSICYASYKKQCGLFRPFRVLRGSGMLDRIKSMGTLIIRQLREQNND